MVLETYQVTLNNHSSIIEAHSRREAIDAYIDMYGCEIGEEEQITARIEIIKPEGPVHDHRQDES